MTYSAAVAYLYGLQKHGIKLGLETMQALMHRLGNPEARYRTLHIAGTNGKGSTAAIAAAVLQAAGYRVGLYTSPHLVEFRERIRINGTMISELEVARMTEVVQQAANGDLSPTFFECATAMAFQYFSDAQVDIAVLEVGLGGRFDATNVAQPMACAITTIAMDHQEYLGSTPSAIAFEKAGIIKPNIPVVLGRIRGEARQTIEQAAQERAAEVWRLDEEFRVEGSSDRFDYASGNARYTGLSCALIGDHQMHNAACAIALLEAANRIDLPEQALREGLAAVRWEGRLETVERHPTVLLDGAHNPAGAAALAEYLRSFRRTHPRSQVILVLGMMRDKDHRGFAEVLSGVAEHVVLTQADLPRSATVQELQCELRGLLPVSSMAMVPADALALAKRLAAPEDLVCVTGSLMLVGEVKAALRGCGLSPLRG
ncbi:MAG: bifunctional folylpolyglutamate synthase/dihydrofolate synthase [Nitrospira sp. CR1.3]|nr:bifunctional folylpolyglutamate synthase/dihydrofolate synthase [Nitrospira sp. CR1.3]